MPESKGKHLDIDDRRIVEDGIRDGLSAREIARRLKVSPTTVTREVLANRTVRPPKRKDMTASKRCARYADCQRSGDACASCVSWKRTLTCRRCHAAKCFESCDEFELRMCEKTQSWPYVCTCYTLDRDGCFLPKCRYVASEADAASRARRADPRRGISVDAAELARMLGIIRPLVRQGQSLEAIWMAHGGELPVTVRTFYNYIEAGVVDIASLELPRKVRYKKRRKADPEPARDRIDRTGRRYEDFLALADDERLGAVQVDTVVGHVRNSKRILSIHFPRFIFQLYLLLSDGGPGAVVSALDAVEIGLGSREAFAALLGVLLLDRGVEFDDYRGMERSVLEPGKRRCRVYYCDAMSPSQKPNCERNHEELRRILPKGRSDFDLLSTWDVAVACSHVNSYPRKALGGACPLSVASQVLPEGFLDAFGIERVGTDDVVLRPSLMPHVVKQ